MIVTQTCHNNLCAAASKLNLVIYVLNTFAYFSSLKNICQTQALKVPACSCRAIWIGYKSNHILSYLRQPLTTFM